MSEIVSLSKARKARARDDKRRSAEENRVRFGRTRAERDAVTGERDRADRTLDGHRRDAAPDAPERD